MRCERCGGEYPSEYYFKTEAVCLDCYGKMSAEEKKSTVFHSLMKHPMTSTTFGIEGYRIVKQFGVVRGVTVRSRSILGNIGAGLQTLFGGNIKESRSYWLVGSRPRRGKDRSSCSQKSQTRRRFACRNLGTVHSGPCCSLRRHVRAQSVWRQHAEMGNKHCPDRVGRVAG